MPPHAITFDIPVFTVAFFAYSLRLASARTPPVVPPTQPRVSPSSFRLPSRRRNPAAASASRGPQVQRTAPPCGGDGARDAVLLIDERVVAQGRRRPTPAPWTASSSSGAGGPPATRCSRRSRSRNASSKSAGPWPRRAGGPGRARALLVVREVLVGQALASTCGRSWS